MGLLIVACVFNVKVELAASDLNVALKMSYTFCTRAKLKLKSKHFWCYELS